MGEVSVLLDRDDAVMPVGMKRNRLLMAASADFTSFVDDDDAVAPDYVERVMDVIRPDVQYVGFGVRLTVDGVEQKPVYHSLRYPEWSEDEHGYYRGISHLNPLRRSLALLGLPFQPGFGEDKAWADRVMATGRVKREVFIDGAPVYEYRYSTTGSLFAGGQRHVGAEPTLPAYAHVRDIRTAV